VTDPALVAKKLAAIETALADLRRLAQPERLTTDLLQRRFVEHTLQIAIQASLDVASHIVSDNRLASRERIARCSRCSRKPVGSTRRCSTVCPGWWASATSWSTVTTTSTSTWSGTSSNVV